MASSHYSKQYVAVTWPRRRPLMSICILSICILVLVAGQACSGYEETSNSRTSDVKSMVFATTTSSSFVPKGEVTPASTEPMIDTEQNRLRTEARESTAMQAGPRSGAERDWPRFVEGAAPGWPFVGLVQMWANSDGTASGEADVVWWLRYWSEELDAAAMPMVPLPGLEIECLGRVGMVSHGERGIEVGGAPGAASGSYLVRWGMRAQRLDTPSEALLGEIDRRPSSVTVSSVGDVVSLAAGEQRMSYAMRDPARMNGDWWRVQARHDGDLLVLSVHPANHECFSGVTWLVDAAAGETVACGANTWATRFVAPDDHSSGELVLPSAEEMGTYLGCGARLELTQVLIRSGG